MNGQGSMFELGDSLGDELARTSEDGATWTEPSLWQQGREATRAELKADNAAAELAERHRATLAANGCAQCDCADPTALDGLAGECDCTCHGRELLPIMGHGPNGPVRYGRHQL